MTALLGLKAPPIKVNLKSQNQLNLAHLRKQNAILSQKLKEIDMRDTMYLSKYMCEDHGNPPLTQFP